MACVLDVHIDKCSLVNSSLVISWNSFKIPLTAGEVLLVNL